MAQNVNITLQISESVDSMLGLSPTIVPLANFAYEQIKPGFKAYSISPSVSVVQYAVDTGSLVYGFNPNGPGGPTFFLVSHTGLLPPIELLPGDICLFRYGTNSFYGLDVSADIGSGLALQLVVFNA